jgi:acyl CoA:acetate/3-ketoacid CoA transferase beta subunit
VNEDMSGVVEVLHRMLRDAEAEMDILYENEKKMMKHIRRLQSMLKTAGGEPVKGKPKRTEFRVSPETRTKVVNAILNTNGAVIEDVPGSFTVQSLAAAAEVHQSSVRAAVYQLRDEGHVRMIGRVKTEHGINPAAYALIRGTDV